MASSPHRFKVGRLVGRFVIGQSVGKETGGCGDIPEIGILVVFLRDAVGAGYGLEIGPLDGWDPNIGVGFASSTSDVKRLGLTVRYSIGALDGADLFADVVEKSVLSSDACMVGARLCGLVLLTGLEDGFVGAISGRITVGCPSAMLVGHGLGFAVARGVRGTLGCAPRNEVGCKLSENVPAVNAGILVSMIETGSC